MADLRISVNVNVCFVLVALLYMFKTDISNHLHTLCMPLVCNIYNGMYNTGYDNI